MKNIKFVKNTIKKECEDLGNVEDWFYRDHLLTVEKFAKELLRKLPAADEEILMLSVWLHDIQRVRGIKGDHAAAGAEEASRFLAELGYDKKIITAVKENIESHRCNSDDKMPSTIEGKILASADAMSHFVNDFYLDIATTSGKSTKQFKKWALEKIDRDYNKKIFFDFAKKMVEKQHDIILRFLEL
ncbi:MAG: tRNA 2'-O-methylase [candidate division WS2 bacterium ADurb.Bin280]|uniref:tRNA 2'-O-methylase n=1 Tax=candidate division WS2 bacterium ADurb.Bin280 TaxID=1852829 RepID=A0A1V5SDQ3_9BACT|nr:MAG: tRNA 2'-O-methylase [candidate division WS2 bacterium ADurb.Bin280]